MFISILNSIILKNNVFECFTKLLGRHTFVSNGNKLIQLLKIANILSCRFCAITFDLLL